MPTASRTRRTGNSGWRDVERTDGRASCGGQHDNGANGHYQFARHRGLHGGVSAPANTQPRRPPGSGGTTATRVERTTPATLASGSDQTIELWFTPTFSLGNRGLRTMERVAHATTAFKRQRAGHLRRVVKLFAATSREPDGSVAIPTRIATATTVDGLTAGTYVSWWTWPLGELTGMGAARGDRTRHLRRLEGSREGHASEH